MTRRPLFSAASAWLAGILILASGCMDQSPTAALLDPAIVSDDQRAQLPARVTAVRAAATYDARTVSASITPAGGAIDFGIGTIVFPKHAVQRTVEITASVDGATMAVAFGPHLEFDGAQPTLCFDVSGVGFSGIHVVHFKDDGTSAVVEHSVDGTQLCVRPASFSKFILAAE